MACGCRSNSAACCALANFSNPDSRLLWRPTSPQPFSATLPRSGTHGLASFLSITAGSVPAPLSVKATRASDGRTNQRSSLASGLFSAIPSPTTCAAVILAAPNGLPNGSHGRQVGCVIIAQTYTRSRHASPRHAHCRCTPSRYTECSRLDYGVHLLFRHVEVRLRQLCRQLPTLRIHSHAIRPPLPDGTLVPAPCRPRDPLTRKRHMAEPAAMAQRQPAVTLEYIHPCVYAHA